MPVVADILASYRRPGAVMRRKLGPRSSEGSALAMLMLALGLLFVAQWPRLAREAELDPAVPLDARMGGALLGIVFILPLLCYALAGLSWLVMKLIRRPVSGLDSRIALFWALLATAPFFLLSGLVSGFLPPGPGHYLVGGLMLAAFLWLWSGNLREAATDPS